MTYSSTANFSEEAIQSASNTVSTVPEHELDPLLCKVDLPLCEMFYPVGFSLEIRTNDKAVLTAARESWGSMVKHHDAPKLRLTLSVTDSESLACPPGIVARAQGHLISFVADAQNQVVCDLKQGFAFGCVTRAAAHNRAYLRYHFLEAAALIMICTGRATCLHAATVSWHGHGMLLCGDSGAGKSTLSYACARSGWTYTSDDTSFLLWNLSRPSVIGNSRQVRFRPSAREIFPEIAGRCLTPRAEGKPSIEVPTAELPGIVTSDTAEIQSILLLKRQAAARPTLTELPHAAVREYFLRRLYPTPEIKAIHLPVLEVLSAATVYEFRYDDLSLAIDCLKRMVESTEPSKSVRSMGHLHL